MRIKGEDAIPARYVAAFIQEQEKSFDWMQHRRIHWPKQVLDKGPRAVSCLQGSNLSGSFRENIKYL